MPESKLLDMLLDELADRVAARLSAPKATEFVDQQSVGFDAKTYVRAARAGEFPASKIGRRWVARRADVERWLEGKRPRPPGDAVDLPALRARLGLDVERTRRAS